MKLDSGDTGFDSDEDLTKPTSLDEKFSRALNALLSDDDSPDHKDNGGLTASAQKQVIESAEKSSGNNSKNVSAEIPDYSADFNSESEKIGNILQKDKLKDLSEDDLSEDDSR